MNAAAHVAFARTQVRVGANTAVANNLTTDVSGMKIKRSTVAGSPVEVAVNDT